MDLRTNETENKICTSLKSEFYFRFLWPPSTKSTLNSFHSGRIFATIRAKICLPQSRNYQNRNSHTCKIVSTSGLSHNQQAFSQPHFRAVRKDLRKMVKNCARNRSRPDEIDTETEICTSLKSEFYFRFRWPPSTKSTMISYISVRFLVTICGEICPPQSLNWKNRILHTCKNGNLLPVCLRNNRHLADHMSEP